MNTYLSYLIKKVIWVLPFYLFTFTCTGPKLSGPPAAAESRTGQGNRYAVARNH